MAQPLYSTVEIVRQGLMNVGEKNISNDFINAAIRWASSDCDFLSGYSNWQTTDPYYGTIEGACEQLAVCYAIGLQNDKDVRQMNLFKMVMEKLAQLKETLIASGVISVDPTGGSVLGAGINFVEKQTSPMNRYKGEIYAARRKGIISTEGGNYGNAYITEMDNSDFV